MQRWVRTFKGYVNDQNLIDFQLDQKTSEKEINVIRNKSNSNIDLRRKLVVQEKRSYNFCETHGALHVQLKMLVATLAPCMGPSECLELDRTFLCIAPPRTARWLCRNFEESRIAGISSSPWRNRHITWCGCELHSMVLRRGRIFFWRVVVASRRYSGCPFREDN